MGEEKRKGERGKEGRAGSDEMSVQEHVVVLYEECIAIMKKEYIGIVMVYLR